MYLLRIYFRTQQQAHLRQKFVQVGMVLRMLSATLNFRHFDKDGVIGGGSSSATCSCGERNNEVSLDWSSDFLFELSSTEQDL